MKLKEDRDGNDKSDRNSSFFDKSVDSFSGRREIFEGKVQKNINFMFSSYQFEFKYLSCEPSQHDADDDYWNDGNVRMNSI